MIQKLKWLAVRYAHRPRHSPEAVRRRITEAAQQYAQERLINTVADLLATLRAV